MFLFGFSRGAFAARSLAGFIEKVGLLLRERLDAIEEAYALYESGEDHSQSPLAAFLYRLTGRRMPGPDDEAWLPVHFLGVWDTVASPGFAVEVGVAKRAVQGVPPGGCTAQRHVRETRPRAS